MGVCVSVWMGLLVYPSVWALQITQSFMDLSKTAYNYVSSSLGGSKVQNLFKWFDCKKKKVFLSFGAVRNYIGPWEGQQQVRSLLANQWWCTSKPTDNASTFSTCIAIILYFCRSQLDTAAMQQLWNTFLQGMFEPQTHWLQVFLFAVVQQLSFRVATLNCFHFFLTFCIFFLTILGKFSWLFADFDTYFS